MSKRKPKFKVGQIVVDRNGIPRKIRSVNGGYPFAYRVLPEDGMQDFFIERELRELTARERG